MQDNQTGTRHAVPGRAARALTLTAAAVAAVLGSTAARAQEQDRLALEEIVVTSRFREEPLQQIPLAISAITAETLDANGAVDVIDIADWAPNVQIDQLGSGWGPTLAANIRGLGWGDFKPTVEPTVQFYVDDVVIGRPTGAILDLLDLERVEVLRGPQGTLFGKNAIGGVVRLVSRKPGEVEGGDVEVTVGEYNRLDVRGVFDTTLIDDKLFARVSFVTKQKKGWENNVDFRCAMVESGQGYLAGVGDGIVGWDSANGVPIMGVVGSPEDNAFALPTRVSERGTDRNCVVGRFGDKDSQAARGALRFAPNDKFELNFNADVTDQKDTSPYDLVADIASPGLVNAFNAVVAMPTWGVPYDSRFAAPDIYTNYSGFDDNGGIDNGIETPNINNIRQWGTSATFDWYLDAVDFKLILAHREFDAQWGRDSDASPMPINHTLDTFRHDQDTAELRVSGSLFNDRTSWTIGYFNLDQYDLNTNISVLFPSKQCNTTVPSAATPPATGIIGVSCIDRVDNVWVDNSGLFLNTVTDLTDRLSLTVGLRRSKDDKLILQERFNRDGSPNPGFEDPILVNAVSEVTDPMVSLSYQVNDDIMVYGTYQEGFRGGGTTPRPGPGIRVPFGPETLENFEVGIKSDLFDNRLRLNASIYTSVYKDLQQNAAGLDEFGNPAWLLTNAGQADLDGFEIELQSTIGAHWLLDGSISNLNYQLTDLGNASPEARAALGLDPAGAPDINEGPNRSPKWTATVNFGYVTTLGNGSELSFRYGASWRDQTFWGTDNDFATPGNVVPANTRSNARVTWVAPDQEWEASLFCTNCTDTRVTQSTLNFLAFFGTMQQTYIDPEEWGFSIKRRFN